MRRFAQLLVAFGLPALVMLQAVSTSTDNDIALSTTSVDELSTSSAAEVSTPSADETLSTSTTDIDILSTPADKETPECGLNEQFLNCSSCEGTCAAPSPACTADCQEAKCQCLRGFVRHTNGSCVHESSCSQWPVAPKPSTLPPVPTCPLNEIYLGCSTCEGTCAIQTPTCPLGCQPAKCQCIAGFVRHLNGTCVRASSCTAADLSKDGAPLPLTTAAPERPPTCSFNEIYLACASCDGTCADPTPICPLGCQPGRCQCLAGFVRNAKGACVPRTECTGDNFTSTPSSRANRLERQVPLIGEDDRDLDIRPH